MRIEKINDNQIRCTLSNEDLIDRELKITELAYGSEKAKKLFHDMMQQAANEFGFESENIPLMIEAIPLNSESIVLIITKVEDPDELDTRFSKFAPSILSDGNKNTLQNGSNLEACTDEVLELFKKIQGKKTSSTSAPTTDAPVPTTPSGSIPAPTATPVKQLKRPTNIVKIYSFDSFDKLLHATSLLDESLVLSSALYKDDTKETYVLFVESAPVARKDFLHLFHTLAEYSEPVNLSPTVASAYYAEHCTVLLPKNAIQSLSKMM